MSQYIGQPSRAPVALGLKALALLTGFILAGFALAFAVIIIWPVSIAVLIAGIIIAIISASGGLVTATAFACARPAEQETTP